MSAHQAKRRVSTSGYFVGVGVGVAKTVTVGVGFGATAFGARASCGSCPEVPTTTDITPIAPRRAKNLASAIAASADPPSGT